MNLLPKNVVIAVALLAAGFFGAYLRFRPHLGADALYTDGTSVYEGAVGERIRYAVWDEPLPLSSDLNTPGAEGRPAVSPDGRLMVFAVGEPGLNADLYVADLVDGEPTDPRPLAVLSSDWDECAPAFGPDALWFASNRPGSAGGLDLFRASYSGGSFGEAIALPSDINTAADDTDPGPVPGSAAVAFSSNRKRGMRSDHDLYLARELPAGTLVAATESTEADRDAPPTWRVSPLDELNSPFEEREPAFTADGRTIVFASDRDGSLGGFDLFRSLQERGTWLTPESVPGLNGAGDERGPYPSRDGFSMLLSIEEAGGSSAVSTGGDIYRARSLELFRRPGRPIGWVDLLILLALLTLALLAYLAKRWESIEALYKCFLVSMLAHMLLLWWLQDVFVEGGAVDLKGSSAAFQVSLAANSSTAASSNQARDGKLEVARAESPAEQTTPERAEGTRPERQAAAATAVALAQPAQAMPASAAPAEIAGGAAPTEKASTSVPVRHASEAFERMSGTAPAMELAARSTEQQRSEAQAATIERATSTDVAAREPSEVSTPRAVALEAPQRVAALEAPDARQRSAALPRAQTSDAPSVVTVAAPQESSPRREASAAPAFALPAPTQVAASTPQMSTASAANSAPTRASLSPSASTPAPQPSVRPLESSASAQEQPVEFTPEHQVTSARPAEPVLPGIELRAMEAEPVEARSVQAVELSSPQNSLASLLPSTPSPSLRAAPDRAAPRRWSTSARPTTQVAPSFQPMAAVEREEVATTDLPTRRFEHTPYKTRFGVEKIRAIEEHGGSEETEAAVAAGLEYLANAQYNRGHWGDRRHRDDKYHHVHIGKTGLSMLAFLGAGHTQLSGTEHSEVVSKAVRYLLGVQDDETGAFGFTSSYGHAVATYALAECFALTRDEALRDPLNRAIEWIVQHQHTREQGRRAGGWGYYYPDGRTFDSWPRASVSVWQVMALESARLGGLEVEDTVFENAHRFLVRSYDDNFGGFRYSHDPSRLRSDYATLPGSTPASLFALSLLGEKIEDPKWSEAVAFTTDRAPEGYRYISDDHFVYNATGNLYFWYYGTLALFRHGGDDWERWNAAMKETLLPSQGEDGSWEPISTYARFANDRGSDRTYTTAMCVLTLEVYYRYFTPLLSVK